MRSTRTSTFKLAGALAAGLLVVGVLSAVAGAQPATTGTTPGRFGVKPLNASTAAAPLSAAATTNLTLSVRSAATTGVVSPQPKVYLVFWGNQWAADPAGAAPALQNFFAGLYGPADTYNSIFTQYCEGVPKGTTTCGTKGTHIVKPTSTILGGVWFDNAAAAPASATAAQIGAEAVAAAAHFGNTTQTPNLNAQYVIASATGTHPDNFPSSNFCAWHSSTSSTYGKVAFTNLPYVPDLGVGGCTTIASPTALDGYFSTETHEYAETVTDFFPSGGWNGSKGEIGDECTAYDARLTLSTGTFDVQGEYSNSAGKCVTSQP